MKLYHLTVFFVLFIVIPPTIAQQQWYLQTPNLIDIDLHSMHFVNPSLGWVAGKNNRVYKTMDGGNNWEALGSVWPTSTLSWILKTHFSDDSTGWCIEHEGGDLWRTTNGGDTWDFMQTGENWNDVYDFFFQNSQNGWLSQKTFSGPPLIAKTQNGGENWQTFSAPLLFRALYFFDENTGFATGNNKIYKTENGGENWVEYSSLSHTLIELQFVNEKIGWGRSGTILKTSDGGVTWEDLGLSNISDFSFVDSLNGYAADTRGNVYKTIDGGISWESTSIGNFQIRSIQFFNTKLGWLSGYGGRIYRTIDGGQNWVLQTSVIRSNINSFSFYNADTGWASSSDGAVLLTTDGGAKWEKGMTNTTNSLNSIYFHDKKFGRVVGNNGTIMLTTDGGHTWENQVSNQTKDLRFIRFFNPDTGWVVGDDVALKTIDGGNQWVNTYAGTGSIRTGFFINADTGWVGGVGRVIEKTTDGGDNWITYPIDTPYNIQKILFTSPQVGYTTGTQGTILKTTNGGDSWGVNEQYLSGASFYDFSFLNNDKGWVVGFYSSIQGGSSAYNLLYKTTDGGSNWDGGIKPGGIYDKSFFNTLYFIDDETGWLGGRNGLILSTKEGIDINPFPPAQPLNLTLINNSGTVKLEWNANSETDFSHYKIYRDKTLNFTYASHIDLVFPPHSSFIDSRKTGRYYAVSAVDKGGKESILSVIADSSNVFFQDTIPPVKPLDLRIHVDSLSVKLEWASNQEPDFWHYYIYRDTTLNFGFASQIDSVYPPHTSYVDSTESGLEQLYYAVSAVDSVGNESMLSVFVDSSNIVIPDSITSYELQQNYPNPFNSVTTIPFDLPSQSHVELTIYNIGGQKIIDLVDGIKNMGRHTIEWNGTDDRDQLVSSGLYFCRLKVANNIQVRKLLFIK